MPDWIYLLQVILIIIGVFLSIALVALLVILSYILLSRRNRRRKVNEALEDLQKTEEFFHRKERRKITPIKTLGERELKSLERSFRRWIKGPVWMEKEK
jgi:Tfp pilus assembly protein PilE